jgi:hypothetical protein
MAIGQRESSARSAILNPEANVQGDLIVRNLALSDVASGFQHFEPLQMLDALGGFSDCIIDRVFDGGGRRADQLDFLVGMVISHGISPEGVRKSVAVKLLAALWANSFEMLIYTALSSNPAVGKNTRLSSMQEIHHGQHFFT